MTVAGELITMPDQDVGFFITVSKTKKHSVKVQWFTNAKEVAAKATRTLTEVLTNGF
jgi:hypothetical protein